MLVFPSIDRRHYGVVKDEMLGDRLLVGLQEKLYLKAYKQIRNLH